MGPLIPLGFVNPELNLFFAFVIGLGFGYVLEQAGFSSSRKLAGVFYGYDFVVLRVFFTAAVTAMTGILLFNYIGWLDVKLLYVNPFYLWSAIIGGVIMGVGFILGGFCPGTSLVAAVIGRIDAIFFVIGSMIGIFFFGQFYSLFESIYTGNFLGNVYVYDSLGMGREWFAFMLIAVALMAFFITQMIEDKVNDTDKTDKEEQPSYLIATTIVLALGILLLILPQEPRSKWHEKGPEDILNQMVEGKHLVPIDKVAYSLIKPDAQDLLLIDVRSEQDFSHFSLPGAVHIPKQDVLLPRYTDFLKSAGRVVLYSHGETDATEAWMILFRAGHTNVFVMEGGLNHFFTEIFNTPPASGESYDQMQIFQTRFREEAQQYFREGKAAVKPDDTPVPVIKQVEIEMPAGGGC
jgi:rhodanese-related sulfurtransferase/uncharacterized membrane protein YedE/YeeE